MADSLPPRPRNIFNGQNDLARLKYASSSEDEDDNTSDPTTGPSGSGTGPPPPPLPPSGPGSDDDSDSDDEGRGGDDGRDGGAVRAISDGMGALSRIDGGERGVRSAPESTVSEPVRDTSLTGRWILNVNKPDATFVELHLLRRWNSRYDEEESLRAAAVTRQEVRAMARQADRELMELELAEEASHQEPLALSEESPSVVSPSEIPLPTSPPLIENWQETAKQWQETNRPKKVETDAQTSSRASPAVEDSSNTRDQNESTQAPSADGTQSYKAPSAESPPESPVRASATPTTARPGAASVPTSPARSASRREVSFLPPPYSEYFDDSDLQSLAIEIKIELMLAPCKTALKYNKTNPQPSQTGVKFRNVAALALGLAKEWEDWIHAKTIAKCHFYNGLTDFVYSLDDANKRGLRARKHFNLTIRIARELSVSIDEELLASQWIDYIDDKHPRVRYRGGRRDHHDSDSDDSDSNRPDRSSSPDSPSHPPSDTPETSETSHTPDTSGRRKRAASGSRPFSAGRPTTIGKSEVRPGTSYTRAAIPGLNQPEPDRPTTQHSVASTAPPTPLRRTSLRSDILKHPPVGVRELGDAETVRSTTVSDDISSREDREPTATSSTSSWWPGEWFGNPFTNGKASSSDTSRVSQRPHTTGTALEPWRGDHTRDRPNSRQAAPRPLTANATDSTPSASILRHYAESPFRSRFDILQRSDRTSSLQEQKDNDGESVHARRRSRLGSVTTALSSWSRQAPKSPEALLEEGEHPAFSPTTSKSELKASTSTTFSDFPIPGLGNGREVGETF